MDSITIPLPGRIPDPVQRGVALETSDLLLWVSQRTMMEETWYKHEVRKQDVVVRIGELSVVSSLTS
jgi:hypothetical protein